MVNMREREKKLYDHSMNITIFILILNKIFSLALEIMRKVATATALISIRRLARANRMFPILGEKWVRWKKKKEKQPTQTHDPL